jgi:hypothetical protein
MTGVAFLRQLRCPSEHRDRDNPTSRLLAEADFEE